MKEEYSARTLNFIKNVVCYHLNLNRSLYAVDPPFSHNAEIVDQYRSLYAVDPPFSHNAEIVDQYFMLKELFINDDKEIIICNSLTYALNNKNEDNLFFETERKNFFLLISKELVQKIIITGELSNLW